MIGLAMFRGTNQEILFQGNLSNEQLAESDIAELNLRAANCLPGCDTAGINGYLQRLDEWVGVVLRTTERNLPRYHRTPAEFENCEPKFRMLCLVTVLKRDLGVCYDPAQMDGPVDNSDSRTKFIQGPLTGVGGTCSNLPVLYVAIGRRLGYPLKLVRAKEHLFVRWVGADGVRFNIEATTPGFNPWNDEHYHQRPRPLSTAELASGQYLRDLTPRQELADFLCHRGAVCLDNLQLDDAKSALSAASELDSRYSGNHAVATVIASIVNNLRGWQPQSSEDWRLAIQAATPQPREQWQHWATPIAQQELLRILNLQTRKTSIVKSESQLLTSR